LKDNLCAAVSNLCDGYNILTGECLGCVSGYSLNPDGTCSSRPATPVAQPIPQPVSVAPIPQVQQPIQQPIQQPVRPPVQVSIPDPNCVTPNPNGGCINCNIGFYYNGQLCIPIPILNCVIFNNGQCQACVQGYTVQGNNCVSTQQTIQPQPQQPQQQFQFTQTNQQAFTQPTPQTNTQSRDPNCKTFNQQGRCT
jgi:hypothetical protein